MVNFNIVHCRTQAVRAVRLMVGIRKLAKPLGLDSEHLEEMERDFRCGAAALQEVERLWREAGCPVD